MGFYDNNRHVGLGSNIEFDLLEGYCGAAGAAMAALEGQQNDMYIFESAISSDFQEAMAIKEGADIEPLQEASIKGMFDAIINFLKKLGDKIKSIFTSFIAKFESYMKKDTKAFVDKYRTAINSKANFSKMKAKYSMPKQNGDCPYVWSKDYTMRLNIVSELIGSGADTTAKTDDIDFNDEVDKVLADLIPNTDKASFKKDLHELLYDDEEVKDDWTLADIIKIQGSLTAADKAISALKSKNDSLQSQIKKTINAISKAQAGVAKDANHTFDDRTKISIKNKDDKKYTTEPSKDNALKIGMNPNQKETQVALARLQTMANVHQTAIMTYTSATLAEAKWGLAQDRRIYAQAVGYSPKNESALLAEAMGDVAQWECESYFEDAEVLGA